VRRAFRHRVAPERDNMFGPDGVRIGVALSGVLPCNRRRGSITCWPMAGLTRLLPNPLGWAAVQKNESFSHAAGSVLDTSAVDVGKVLGGIRWL
jgi:hypothetical protein